MAMNTFAYATNMTRNGERNMHNRKPYRGKAAKKLAWKRHTKSKWGSFSCQSVPVSYHDPIVSKPNT